MNFFTKNPNLKKKKNCFRGWGEGCVCVGGGGPRISEFF